MNQSYEKESFLFLNLPHCFNENIDWNYTKFGKLWIYNLTYFDYLNQKNISTEEGIVLINDFIDKIEDIKDGLEPFPISLRGINWVKFLIINDITNKNINDSLYAQYQILLDNLEYHLLGNHLLENAFSLLFGAYYFNDVVLMKKAKEILFQELNEQILADGAHFELSPMYHQIMLFRVLDSINLLQNNVKEENKELLEFLQLKASLMLGWLKNISFKNGDIPLFNDSAKNIAPTTKELLEYAQRLSIAIKCNTMKESGYRKFENKLYECVVDIGNIGPDYIPGHAHADTFNFELYIGCKPYIVDTGLSTYETNNRRTYERSTISHNTVEVNKMNQSAVWGGFRVANRAYVINLQENENSIQAIHNGYKNRLNALHKREFIFSERDIEIIDTINADKEYPSISRIHFHPDITEDMIYKHIDLKEINCKISKYQYASEFNKNVDAYLLEVYFTRKITIKISI